MIKRNVNFEVEATADESKSGKFFFAGGDVHAKAAFEELFRFLFDGNESQFVKFINRDLGLL